MNYIVCEGYHKKNAQTKVWALPVKINVLSINFLQNDSCILHWYYCYWIIGLWNYKKILVKRTTIDTKITMRLMFFINRLLGTTKFVKIRLKAKFLTKYSLNNLFL